jgi:hypothetical protein
MGTSNLILGSLALLTSNKNDRYFLCTGAKDIAKQSKAKQSDFGQTLGTSSFLYIHGNIKLGFGNPALDFENI